jgi:hypothetical protein
LTSNRPASNRPASNRPALNRPALFYGALTVLLCAYAVGDISPIV